MTRYLTTVTSSTNYYIADVNKKRDFYQWFGTFIASGNFGGGTMTYKISPDNGTTLIPLFDASGNAITSTASDNFTVNLAGGANNNDAPKLYVTMAGGSTDTSVAVYLYDNNG